MTELQKANSAGYQNALQVLRSGGLVVLPTETVYGVAALATNADAVARLYAIKARPTSKPLSAVVFSRAHAEKLGDISSVARNLMDAFWPGPLTLVVPLKKGAPIAPAALSGGQSIGLRYPDIAWVREFEKAGFKDALVLPSANISGRPAPKTARDVQNELGDKVDLIIDGGACKTGIESTIVSVENDQVKILRLGAIPPEALAKFNLEWAEP